MPDDEVPSGLPLVVYSGAYVHALHLALVEIVDSLVPTYHLDHPEDHGFSEKTGKVIRMVYEINRKRR